MQTLMTGLMFVESPRWHDHRLWFADWGTQEIVAVGLDGKSEVIVSMKLSSLAVTPDNSTLIIAESYGKKLTAFDIAKGGQLSNRRVWADLKDGVPDGICIDAENAVWYADVPNRRCVRVREGGEVLETVQLDLGCFACMLGGADGRTLFIVAREWRGLESTADRSRKGQVLTITAPAPHAGRP